MVSNIALTRMLPFVEGAAAAGAAGIAIGTGCVNGQIGDGGYTCPDSAPIPQCCGGINVSIAALVFSRNMQLTSDLK